MRLHTYLVKLQFLNALAYRFEYLSSIGRNLFFLLGSVFLWRTAYRGIDQVAGVTEAQMVTYAVVAVLMNACFTISVDNVLFGKVRAGEIAIDLMEWGQRLGDIGERDANAGIGDLNYVSVRIFCRRPKPGRLAPFWRRRYTKHAPGPAMAGRCFLESGWRTSL